MWYIRIAEGIEGPFSKEQLKRDPRLTPDTYVWRAGFAKWKKIRDVAELRDLFEENPVVEKEQPTLNFLDEEVALDNPLGLPPYLYWIVIVAIVTIAAIYYLSNTL